MVKQKIHINASMHIPRNLCPFNLHKTYMISCSCSKWILGSASIFNHLKQYMLRSFYITAEVDRCSAQAGRVDATKCNCCLILSQIRVVTRYAEEICKHTIPDLKTQLAEYTKTVTLNMWAIGKYLCYLCVTLYFILGEFTAENGRQY